jgi:ketosteroid isomerase-like protein
MAHRVTDEAEIRQRIDKLIEAIRAMDIEGMMQIYAPNIVSFDIEPPLQHVAAEAKRKTGQTSFRCTSVRSTMRFATSGIAVGDDVAFGHGFIRISGTLKTGNKTERWLRSTTCFRKIAGDWLIAHDQVSVPLDLDSGRALLNLEP